MTDMLLLAAWTAKKAFKIGFSSEVGATAKSSLVRNVYG
jgi:hypothetical protein